jgi:hypothetical protein
LPFSKHESNLKIIMFHKTIRILDSHLPKGYIIAAVQKAAARIGPIDCNIVGDGFRALAATISEQNVP